MCELKSDSSTAACSCPFANCIYWTKE